jgi:catechol 2,3-dioxygenase-like lactoylglutathione lyase family enzyme
VTVGRGAAAPAEVGGVFLATKDVARLVAWYRGLGLPLGDDGMCVLDAAGMPPGPTHGLVFSIQPAKGELPGTGGDLREEPYGLQRLTLNLRVTDLGAVLADLRRRRVAFSGPRDVGYGIFAWVKDPDGNFVELWQPAKPKA